MIGLIVGLLVAIWMMLAFILAALGRIEIAIERHTQAQGATHV